MSHEVMTADDLRWRLSQINPNRPVRVVHVPDDLRSESLLCQDIVELESLLEEWQAIAESYRELAQLAIEAAARQHALSQTLNARLTDVLGAQQRRR